jgi:hypothetical protein
VIYIYETQFQRVDRAGSKSMDNHQRSANILILFNQHNGLATILRPTLLSRNLLDIKQNPRSVGGRLKTFPSLRHNLNAAVGNGHLTGVHC